MPSYVEFAIASGIFLIFISLILSSVAKHISFYSDELKISELKKTALTLFKILFSSQGIPKNWEENLEVETVGLTSKLYSISINVTSLEENSEIIVVNGTLNFDPNCERRIRNNTLRLYNSSNLLPFKLYNQSFCEGIYLKAGEIVFESHFLPFETKIFTLYFSSEKSVILPNYSVEFPSSLKNYTFQASPIQEIEMISVDKLKGLRELNYEEFLQNFSKGFGLRVEIE
ncbi:MAG: hypothetical protein QW451_01035 [Candidatus Aenigmatarchaeota archaeon]